MNPPPLESRPLAARHGLWVGPVFAAVALGVVVAGFLGLDAWFYQHVSLVLETKDQPLDRDFYTVTKPFWLACRYLFAHVLGIALAFGLVWMAHPQRLRAAVRALICVLVAALLANIAQAAIGRLRPNQGDSPTAFVAFGAALFNKENVSFPSGEAATAFALGWVLAHLFPRYRFAFYAAATLGAASRLVNGAHYLSDVVAGALVGVLVASFAFRLLERKMGTTKTQKHKEC